MARRPALTADAALERLRAACFALPAVLEKPSHGAPSFFVSGKMFASFANDHHGDGRCAAWCKATPDEQRELVEAAPDRYFVPPYVGVKGWLGVHLGADTDWEALAVILEAGWQACANKSAREAPVLPPPKAAPIRKTDPAVARTVISKIETFAAALPGVELDHAPGSVTLRVKKKSFATVCDNHHGDGIIGLWLRGGAASVEAHRELVARTPERYYIPPYLGPKGWLGLRLDTPSVDWTEVERRLAEARAGLETPAQARVREPAKRPEPTKARGSEPASRPSTKARGPG